MPAPAGASLSAHISEAAAAEKPIYLRSRGLPRGAFRRIGASDIVCTEDDLYALFHLRGTKSYDETPVDGAVWADLDPQTFRAYRRLRAELNPAAVELGYDDLGLAQALCAVVRKGAEWTPTVAGILLFGTTLAVRRFFPMHRIDYLRIDGKEWVRDPGDRYQGIEVREALVTAIPRVVSNIMDDIPKAMSLPEGQVGRREVPRVPFRAVREAVVNAVMHRNYHTQQPTMILRYSNRLEFRNAGASLKPDDQLGEPGSVLRNRRIADVLHETPFAEAKGSGIRTIRDTMTEAGLAPPFFESDHLGNQFIATFLFHHFLGSDDIAWLANFKDLHLSDEDARALIFLREAGAINNAAYRMLNRVDTLTASGRLRNLRDANLLEQKGKSSATYYVPGPRFLASSLPDMAQPAATPHTASSREAPQTSVGAQTPAHKPLSAEVETLSAELPSALKTRAERLGQRATPGDLDATLCALCAWRPLTLRQLSALTRRKEGHLRQRSLKRLLAAGKLAYTHPEEINHPDQAYTATPTTSGETAHASAL